MNEERAFAALTLLVAVTEQAIVELEQLVPVSERLVEELVLIRDDATVVAARLREPSTRRDAHGRIRAVGDLR